MGCLSASKPQMPGLCLCFFDSNDFLKSKILQFDRHRSRSQKWAAGPTAVDVEGLLSAPCLWLSVWIHRRWWWIMSPRSQVCAVSMWSRKLHIYDGLRKNLLPNFHQSAVGREGPFPFEISSDTQWSGGPLRTLSMLVCTHWYFPSHRLYHARIFGSFISQDLLPPSLTVDVLSFLVAACPLSQSQKHLLMAKKAGRVSLGHNEAAQMDETCPPHTLWHLHILCMEWLSLAVLLFYPEQNFTCCFKEQPPSSPNIAPRW